MPRKRSKSPKHKTRPRSKSKKTKSRSKSKNRKYGGAPDPTPVKINKYGREIFVQEWIDNTGVYNNPNFTEKTGLMVFKVLNYEKVKLDANYVESILTINEGHEVKGSCIVKEWREGTREKWKYRESKSENGFPTGIPEARVIMEKSMSFDDKKNDTPCKIVYRFGSESYKMLFKIYFCANKFWLFVIPSDLWADVPDGYKTDKKVVSVYNNQNDMNNDIDKGITQLFNANKN